MLITNNTNDNYTVRQLKLPLEIEKLIDISDPVYTFCDVMDHIDLRKYFVEEDYKTGRPRCDAEKLLKMILFAFMEHGMKKYMKFTMFAKETKDKKYHANPYRAVNFKQNENGELICPNGKRFIFKCNKPVRRNKYGRTEELYECEDCEECLHRKECFKKATGNRTIRLNKELTSIHQEVIHNLESIHGALLRMNRSIQAEGTFGIIKWNRSYKRLFRRGKEGVNLELTLISCGYNLYKYHNKRNRVTIAA